ncbi:MAG: biopolymer transporter ExbD [Gemmatimonadetes bacterium]|nr:biopolymer transporter ExbD [Gemmatimonadota bacterium]
MGMSVGGGSGVKAEPNVVPMIDVMLVLLIIFMVVTPAITSGFTAVAPEGVNLKAHPEEDLDQVLGIDASGKYYMNKKSIDMFSEPGADQNEKIGNILRAIYDKRTVDKILYIKAHKELEYGKILDAMDIASKAGVRVVGAVSDQRPGTTSSVEGDNPQDVKR